jgi:hypothetical protein
MLTPINLPVLTKSVNNFEWWKESNTQQPLESPLDGTVQDIELPGARWCALWTWPPLVGIDAGRVEAFLNALRGRAGCFLLPNYQRPVPNGSIGTAGAQINGDQVVAASLNLKGITSGKTLLAGDFIGFNSELRQVVADATANGAGLMTVQLDCPFRKPVTNGMNVVTDHPMVIMKLTTNEAPHGRKGINKVFEYAEVECREIWDA